MPRQPTPAGSLNPAALHLGPRVTRGQKVTINVSITITPSDEELAAAITREMAEAAGKFTRPRQRKQLARAVEEALNREGLR